MRSKKAKAVLIHGSALAMCSAAWIEPAWGEEVQPSAEAAQGQRSSEEADAADERDDIVVTGVLSARSIEQAPISITAVTREQIDQQALTSAADLLRTVPGVFVNNALGEIRNVVFSRGVSANSLDADSGYFYVSLQEDGLPVEPILASNFGPDYFARPDVLLSRLEALRGGTAAITGPNAPGGIFNYISRTGRSDPGGELQVRLGLEGNGRNEFYRADAYLGGQIGRTDLYYTVGGFYRQSRGARDPGFNRNEGGQIRGSLLWDYDGGSLLLMAKYLNDRNSFDEFMPARNFQDPRLARPYANTSTVLPPPGDRPYTTPDGRTPSWNAADAVHSRAISFGVNWEHEITDDIRIENRARYSNNKSDWSVGAVISSSPLNNFGTYVFTGNLGAPGTLSLRFPDGALAATVVSATGFDYTVTANNLPNQNILNTGVQTLLGFSPRFRSENFQDQLTVTGTFGGHSLAAGAYFQTGKLRQKLDVPGFALLTLEPRPRFLDIDFTLPAALGGATYQVTSPTGFANFGAGFGGDSYSGTQDTLSFVLADSWAATDRLTIDVGVRYERIEYDIRNTTLIPFTGNRFAVGGADGNPLTLFDNGFPTIGAPTRTRRTFDFFNFSGSIAYTFSDVFNAYVRYTRGKKAPSFGVIQTIDTAAEVATIFPKAQQIEQIELGLKYRRGGLDLQVYPFYSKLSNVADNQTFTDETGTAYSPPPVFGQIETYGVEIQANADISDQFNLYAAVTIQDPKASGFSTYLQNGLPQADDQLVTIPPGDADNNPKLIVRTTGTFRPTQTTSLFATFSYLGERAANRFNAFYLPGFSTVDLGASIEFGSFRLQANVNNLLNNYGILSYSRSGSLLASLDRQGLTRQQVEATGNSGLLQVIPSQPRAFFLTGTLQF